MHQQLKVFFHAKYTIYAVQFLLVCMLFSAFIFIKEAIPIYYALCFLGFLALISKQYQLDSRLKNWIVTVLLLVAYMVIRVIVDDWLLLFTWRFEYIKILLLMPLFAIIFHYAVITEQHGWRIFTLATLSCVIWLIVYAMHPHEGRSNWAMSIPIVRGNLAMLAATVSIITLLTIHGRWWKFLAALSFVSGLTLSIFSASRGGWLAPITCIMTSAILLWYYGHRQLLVILGGITIFSIAILLMYWDYLPIESRILKAIADFKHWQNGNVATSIGLRLEYIKASYYAIQDNFWLGSGWNSYRDVQEMLIQSGVLSPDVKHYGHPHNLFLMYWVETGFIGFILFTMMLTLPVWQALSRYKRTTLANHISLIFLVLLVIESYIIFCLSDINNRGHFILIIISVCLFALPRLYKVKHSSHL